jgi:transcriptional regulator with XRE-family HTH domain
MQIDASFGEKIKQRREDKKLSQFELAKLLGITPAAVCQWETRGTVPRAKTLAKVAEVLNVSEQFLAEGPNGAEPSPPGMTKGNDSAPKGTLSTLDNEEGVVTLAEVVERTRKQIAELMGLSSDQLKLTLTVDGLDATAAGNRAVKKLRSILAQARVGPATPPKLSGGT